MLDKSKESDGLDRHDSDEFIEPDSLAAQVQAPKNWSRFLTPGNLTSRIVLLNLMGLIILVVGILYFNQFRQGLIDARVQSLTTQAQIIAAAIAGSATADTGSIVINPDSLADSLDDTAPDADQLNGLDFPVDPETAGPVLRRLLANTTIRARIIDPGGNLVVDSRFLLGGGDIQQSDLQSSANQNARRPNWLNRIFDWFFAYDYPLQTEYNLDNGKDYPEVAAALNGASVSVVRLDENREIIVLVSVPIQRFRAVLGALILSTKGGDIDQVLRAERKVVLLTFGFVALVTLLLSLLLASTIANPIRKLSAAAERVRQGINKRVEIPDFTRRQDEIGHLSGAIRDMTNALYNRIDAIEAFAADVSHELKNPLTSLRSAVETLGLVKTDEQRNRLVEIVKHDVKRLDRLITDISNASRLDAELARAETETIDMAKLLGAIVSVANETRKDNEAEIILVIQPITPTHDPKTHYLVTGHDLRLGQVFRNLLDNARSFAPATSRIHVRLRRMGALVETRVEDQGPGIGADNLERIFERFYTDRPEAAFGKNSGLGLSISKQIVEAHKGKIWAENRLGKAGDDGVRKPLGARFIVSIPAAQNTKTSSKS
jgi:two-component system, OmpR family, sensor histidine kinase ChvG